jgi:uncharacterized membrane protein/thiol-disulfide isomerase/thioredoxin
MTPRPKPFILALLSCFLVLSSSGQFPVLASNPVVRAVLFYSPTCPHCHQVIEEVLLPLLDQYGEQLDLVGIDISTPGGSALFGAAIDQFAIPADQQGVPMLFVGETVLIGSLDIPAKLPGLIEQYLAAEGADWPAIPGLLSALETAEPQPTTSQDSSQTPEAGTETAVPESSVSQTPTRVAAGLALTNEQGIGTGARLAQDPAGNALAIVILLGMLGAVIYTLGFLRPGTLPAKEQAPSIWVPIICLVGIAIAGYLTYIETTHVEAVCGPVGDCNTVQQSEYARLFGVVPVGLLGLTGYVAILITWVASRYGPARIA